MYLERIKLIPLPLTGVILSIFGLGLFFRDISPISTNILTIIGVVLIFLVFLKLFLYWEESKEDLKSPIILGTFATLPMAIMILSVLVNNILIWIFAVVFHIVLIIHFTKEHILNFKLNLVYTNYFVVFIGIGMASITGSAFNLQFLIDMIFIFSFISMIILLILVSYRYVKIPISKQTFKPLICIYAAPFSLLFCGFIQTSIAKPTEIILVFYILSVIFYIFGLVNAIKYIFRIPFFPTFAAFTFPFIISATATKQFIKYFGINLEIFLLFQISVAIILVVYVLVQYIYFIITAPQ